MIGNIARGKLWRKLMIGLLLISLVSAPAVGQSGEGIESRLDSFNQARITLIRHSFHQGQRADPDQLYKLFQKYFGTLLKSGSLVDADDETMRGLFHAVRATVSSTHGRYHALDIKLLQITLEIYRRGLSPSDQAEKANELAQSVYDTFLGTRQFDLANALRAKLSSRIEPSPYESIDISRVSAGQPAVLIPSDNATRLEARPVAINHGRWLVSVLHTGCPFSRRAMAWIEEHRATIEPLLPDNAIWVAGQRVTHIIPDLENWNKQSQLIDIHVIYRDADWPKGMVTEATPAFYLVDDGKVVDRLVGWVDDTQAIELESMLRKFTGQGD